FDIDANGIMHVTAKDLGTGKEQKMTVTGGSSLPRQDIDRMIREAEQHAEEDRRRKEEAETRNSAEQLVYQTERLLRDNESKIPADLKTETETAIADLKEKLKGQDTTAIRTATEHAGAVAQKIGTALYDTQRAAAAGDGPTSDTGSSGTEEEVVDAEIVDDESPKGDARGAGAA
ncbi:Hsp70 family protein, partial [Streptomyces sp. NPDC029216]|uniref:Hsp70 family protein n=1 Tax=Streptomyces sp. NPDC029216 TaxID=3154701 RepID=UPI0033D8C8F3